MVARPNAVVLKKSDTARHYSSVVSVTSRAAPARSYYRTLPPRPALRPFVECLWVRAIPGAEIDEDRRILPDGRMDLVWIRRLGVVVAGPQSRFTTRPVVAPMLAFGARFHPGVAPLLLRLPAVEFINDHVPLEAVDARLAMRLGHELAQAPDQWTAFAALERELMRLVEGLKPDPVVREAVALLEQRSITVAETAARVFVSERQLERRFVEYVGYGPKMLQRILRLQYVVEQLRLEREAGELARAAASAGYADQPHLSRESRRLTGLTPRQLARWAG
jgi:AraC-like DNA-binding protein